MRAVVLRRKVKGGSPTPWKARAYGAPARDGNRGLFDGDVDRRW